MGEAHQLVVAVVEAERCLEHAEDHGRSEEAEVHEKREEVLGC